uniref:Uncharacterized protein n=1 Tax=Trichogramma kaykai TaxID=54128 RepID=A0ABD2WAP5_9HYME
MEEFEEEGSGWALSKILHLLVIINKYNPSRVGSYIPLPKVIKDKNACVTRTRSLTRPAQRKRKYSFPL